jgi:hypothetical protein
LSEEEILRNFYKIDDGTMHNNYVIAESVEEAIAKWKKIDPEAVLEGVELVGIIHE